VVNEAIEVLPGRIRREGWVEQCQRLFAEVRRH
jgi:predicted flap endonuclease-1-like 5' DNA nuclease